MSGQRDDDTTVLARSGFYRAVPDAALPRAHYLLIIDGEGRGRRIPVGREPIVLGRASPPADFVLNDQRISRGHCRVVAPFDEVVVADLGSSNGTFIDGKRIKDATPLPVGSRLALGSHVLEHEWRLRKEVEESQELDRDIDQASRYITALLPPPLTEGPVFSDWVLVPCARLGGDAFGYRFLDDTHFAIYLIDVSGHGAGAAMHAVSTINVLRQGALSGVDFRDPGRVLEGLNAMFRMDTHGDMYLTVWYGVYDLTARTLTYSCAGHHSAYLVTPGRGQAIPLGTRNRAIGVVPGSTYEAASCAVTPGSVLYVFSDGVFEITDRTGTDWTIEGFVSLLLEQPREPAGSECSRLLGLVREHARESDNLQDDFTLMAFTFQPRATRAVDETWPDRPTR
jgi:serine phosphatase RsbU (regulator of sigma subunit)